MPIQFACIHCDQRLSVRESKVGAVVKCPQCKRTLTVPDAAAAAAILEDRRRRRETEKETPFSQFAVYDDETEIVYEHEIEVATPKAAPGAEGLVDPARVAVPRVVLYLQGFLLAGVAIVAFTLGLLVGGAFDPSATTLPEELGPHVVRGALYFETAGPGTSPEVDAVAMLLPLDARPETRPDGSGLGPASLPPADDHAALQAIRQIGGDYARTTADGRFRLDVPRSGRYYLLLISREKAQSQAPDPAMLAELGAYLQNAPDLIGDRAFQWREERLRGDKTVTHVFK